MYILLGVASVCLFILIRWVLRSLHLSNNDTRYVFITGCNTGFGNLLAKRLDRKGVNVIAGCLTADGTAALRNAYSRTLKTVELDVSKETSIRQAKIQCP
ncbi:hypothetical protein DPMN_058918 [Dreissena polymorpha]|uniref:Uncharacterized protein n=1 Tax=Dreissena polymorpha TaxID=45954 RepID=A0A9D4C2Y8_DREPO|nr:hypothetical protein DPMN_058918 [Dreissena polymorpha]